MYCNAVMAQPYDVIFRERALTAYDAGEGGYHALAALFGIGYRTLQRWVAQHRATGSVAARSPGGGWRCPIDLMMLRTVVGEAPDATVGELCWEYNRRVPSAERSTRTSFGRAMRRAGFVLKKNGRGRVNSIGRTWRRSARRS